MTDIQKSTMTSLEIATLTGKRHADIMRSIREMEVSWEKIAQRKFTLGSYIDGNKQERPQYELSKTECLYIATKFNDESRAKLILRWEELENTKKDLSRLEILQMALASEKELIATRERLELAKATIEDNKPKVVFADSVAGSNNAILIREFAKLISKNGYEIGQNRLFSWFRNNGYLMNNNEPYQNYVAQGYFEVIERTIGDTDRTVVVKTTKITGAGQVYFAKKLTGKV